MPEPEEIEISDRTIRLGQLLKLANLVESGSDVKLLLADGEVEVNGEPETRRGRQVGDGDTVRLGDNAVRVAAAGE